jgi:ABC-type sugar transport system ATPase subunit
MNLLAAQVLSVGGAAASLAVEGIAGEISVAARPGQLAPGDRVTMGLRPEHLAVVPEGALSAEIGFVERLGTTSLLYAPAFPAGPLIIEFRGANVPGPGRVSAAPDLAQAHIFDKNGILVPPA